MTTTTVEKVFTPRNVKGEPESEKLPTIVMAKSKENVGEILKAVPFDKALEIQTAVLSQPEP